MKTLANVLGLLAIVTSFISCGGNSKKPPKDGFKFPEEPEEVTYMQSGDEIAVPFREKGGVKCVDVWVNGMGVEMIYDTGCSYTLISKTEAEYLCKKGMLTQEDFLGVGHSQIADGSIVENMVINLKEVVVDGKIPFYDVVATVSNSENAPLLLGNEVLDRVATVTVDNENKIINFKIK